MGISHLLEHMVFKGTERRTAKALALELEVRGGSLDAFTGRDYTSYQAHTLDADLPLAVEILTDLARRPLLRESDLEPERNVILEEINGVEDTPDDLVFELHAAELWPRHPYGYSILGNAGTLAALSADDLRCLHETGYYRGNFVVAAAGNVEPRPAARPCSSARAGSRAPRWSRPGVPVAPPRPPFGAPSAARTRETAQTHIVFGTDTFPLRDPRRFALAILTNVFGGGMSSRLFQRVREELGLAYAIFAYKHFYQSSGQLGVYIGTQPATADAAVAAIAEEYARLAREGLPADELADGKRQLKGQVMLSLESPGARMGRLAGFILHADDYRPLDQMLAEIDAVTAPTTWRRWRPSSSLPSGRPSSVSAPDGSRPAPGPSPTQPDRGPMLIGVPKEIKTNENRIALVPAGAEALTAAGHTVFIEAGAGLGSGFPDEAYTGGRCDRSSPTAEEVWQRAEMIMKVKEPIAVEWPRMRPRPGDLHLLPFRGGRRPHPGGHRLGRDRGGLRDGSAPERRAAAAHARCRRWPAGWRCRRGPSTWRRSSAEAASCSGGVPGVAPGEVVIIGGGVVGINAAKMAAGLGAHVTILDISLDRLRYLDDVLPANVDTAYSNRHNILDAIAAGRPGDRGRAAAGRQGAAPRQAGRPQDHEARDGDRGRGGRPGRLRRDDQAHHPREPHLLRRRHSALRGRQYARRGAPDLHPGPDQCHAAVCT